jgi:hypothetical protein
LRDSLRLRDLQNGDWLNGGRLTCHERSVAASVPEVEILRIRRRFGLPESPGVLVVS